MMRANKQKKSATSGSIRIIAGHHRGRKLPVLESPGLRPTTDRTKETLFNWLMHDIQDAVCVDGFAGTGSLGFEALSRGASFVYFIEKSAPVTQQIKHNINTLQLQPKSSVLTQAFADAAATLQQQLAHSGRSMDIVLLDPPFQQGLLIPSLCRLIELKLITHDSLIYIECESALTLNHINTALKQQFGKVSINAIKKQLTGGFMYGLFQLNA